MILRHRLAPERQGEVWSDLLRLVEVLGRIFVFEVMELRKPEQKIRLSRRRPRIHKRNFTKLLLGVLLAALLRALLGKSRWSIRKQKDS